MDAVVRLAGEIVPDGEPDGSIQQARVVVDEVLWQTLFPANEGQELMLPVPVGAHVMVGDERGWAKASDALATGSEVALGLLAPSPEHGYFAEFMIKLDPDSATFLGESPFAEYETGMFNAFLSWGGNPLAGSDPTELLRAWNVEADAPLDLWPQEGPISLSWDRFREEFVTGPEYPTVGTLEYWNSAPPQCRGIDQAPPGVRESLVELWIWVKVPSPWLEFEGRTLCFGTSIASVGCTKLDAVEGWSYVPFDEAYAVPGEPIQVSVPRIIDGAPSWLQRVPIGTIPFTEIAPTRFVLMELNADFALRTFEELQAYPNASELATARSLTLAEHESLKQQWPALTPQPPEADDVP